MNFLYGLGPPVFVARGMFHQAGHLRSFVSPGLRGFTLVLALCGAAFAAPLKFDLPAQPAPAALRQFIKQSGTQVLFGEQLDAVTTRAVAGEMESAEALNQMLAGTGFAGTQTTPGNFVVAQAGPAANPTGEVRGTIVRPKLGSSAGIRVVVKETGQLAVTDQWGDFMLARVEAGTYTLVATAEGLQPMHITDVRVRAGRELVLGRETMRTAGDVTQLEPYVVKGRADEVTALDKYVVEGRKEKPFVAGNMDIPRTANDVQPYYIFDSKTIDRSGAMNIEDFLKQRLTMNTVMQSNGQITGYNNPPAGNTSTVNLRGVGADKTLILVDGRRLPGVSIVVGSSFFDNQPDLNGIPLNAIDRIEVLPSSASGIYGGSAIGGVVNVILKHDYQGGEIRATYDNAWNTDSPLRSVSLSYGQALEGGRTHVMFNASWSDEEPMLLQDRRGIFEANIARIQHNAPTYLNSGTSLWVGSLPNIMPVSSTQTTLTLKNGAVINSRNTYIAAGTSPTTSAADLYASLLANGGQWVIDLPPTTQYPGLLRPFGATPTTRSFRASVRRQMLPRLEVFADFGYDENKSFSIYNPFTAASQTSTVPINAPTNPFTTAVSISIPDASQATSVTRSVNRTATLGAIAHLPWDWTGELDYSLSENRYKYFYYSADSSGVASALASGALNPFVDALHYPLDLQPYYLAQPYQGSTQLHDFSLRASGPLPALPWGKPTLTVGLEHRLAKTPERTVVFTYPVSVQYNEVRKMYARDSITDSGYAEATVPLVKQAWLPGVRALDLQLSGRSERYTVDTGTPYEWDRTTGIVYGTPTHNGQPYFDKTSYTSRNYTVGFKYQPVKEVTLRVSRATAFLPPTPAQLLKNPDPESYLTTITDPTTEGRVSVNTLSGGNPNLQPQNSKSLNAGLIWEPTWKLLKGLRLDAEYYKIEQFGYIGTLGPQAIVDQESLYPDRVIRDSNGIITLVDNSLVNLYHRETEGWDLTAGYTLKTGAGTFDLQAMESITLHLKSQYSQTQPEYDAVNFPSESGATKYKTNATLNWDWHRWTASWAVRYFSAYQQYGAAGGPSATQRAATGTTAAARAPSTSYTLPQGSDTIPSQMYHDLFVGYAFGKQRVESGSKLHALGSSLLDGLTVQAGVRNIFNKVPPFDVYYSNNYYLSPYGDTRLRSYWLTVKKTF
ncbi:MAG: TonB-dependent receptor [Lacunisphaera sp.]